MALDLSMHLQSIGIVIPTYQAAKHLINCLPPVLQSNLKPRVLVIDSSSTDGTAEMAESMGAEVLVIPKVTFNHGTTRELGRRHLNTDVVIMMTQDAYLVSAEMLEALVLPLVKGEASLSYARQIPHESAGLLGSFSRQFNYPSESHTRSLEDSSKFGAYTFFCSNSCAAYSNLALDEVGGFPEVLFGEDTIAAAKLLRRGHRIAYVAETQVRHSHDYSCKEEFQRHFDMGISRAANRELFQCSVSKRGRAYVVEMLKEVWRKQPGLLPYACVQTLIKFCGYQAGCVCLRAPRLVKRFFSVQKAYWK